MRILVLLTLLSAAIWAPASAWEIRGNVYPADSGIIEWTPENFAGFYLDEDLETESLVFNISDEQLLARGAKYVTQVQEVPFKHGDWGNYLAICFLGQKYFVGYPESCKFADPWTLLYHGNLSPVLIDSDESYTIASDEPLPLKESYILKLSDAEDGVKATLYKGDELVDSQVLQSPATYVYEERIGNSSAPLIAVGIKANVRLEPTSYYTIKGIFQISQEPKILDIGTEFEKMEVDQISDSKMGLSNPNNISLSKGLDFELMDGFWIKTSDVNASSNQIYLYKNASKSTISEIRGEVATGDFEWTPKNFAGFSYDINNDLGTETLTTTIYDNKLEEPNGITYVTTSQKKAFAFDEWGYYNILAFLGESYVSGYGRDVLLSHSSQSHNLLVYEKLGRVLIDSMDPQIIKDGGDLILQEGLTARLYVDKSCKMALVELYKNDELLDRNYFQLPNTYIYKKRLAGTGEVAILAIHIAEANCSKGKSCLVDGIFQLSEELVDVGLDLPFGKMRIASIDGGNGVITMDNKDRTITLSKNKEILLTGDYYIKTIDGDATRYYIYKPVLI